MLIKKDNGKVKMELTEEELIIKGIFKDKKIKRKDIKSACITVSSFVILTYDYKIIYQLFSNATPKYKEQLKLLVDEINKENNIFKYSYEQGMNTWMYIWVLPLIFTNFNNGNKVIAIILGVVYVILAAIAVWDAVRFKGVIYNVDTKTFTRVGYKDFNKETFTIEDMELVKKKEMGIKYKIKKSGYKFYLEYAGDKILYPVRQGQALKEIENHFIKTEINN